MALARGSFEVIGTRGFILLALHAGHNAIFVTIGGMRAAARRRSAETRRTIRSVRLRNCNCERKRIAMEKCAAEIEKFSEQTVWCRKQLATTYRNFHRHSDRQNKNVRRCMVRDHRGIERCWLTAPARGRRPRRAVRRPRRCRRPGLTGFSGHSWPTQPAAGEPNFGNSANEL